MATGLGAGSSTSVSEYEYSDSDFGFDAEACLVVEACFTGGADAFTIVAWFPERQNGASFDSDSVYDPSEVEDTLLLSTWGFLGSGLATGVSGISEYSEYSEPVYDVADAFLTSFGSAVGACFGLTAVEGDTFFATFGVFTGTGSSGSDSE